MTPHDKQLRLSDYLPEFSAAHGYFKVDLEIVWNTIQNDLAGLPRARTETSAGRCP